MIQILQKRYQVSLWETPDRRGTAPALQLEFDSLDEAQREFEAHRQAGRYRTGIVLEWRKTLNDYVLVDQYPR